MPDLTDHAVIDGRAVALAIANLDTDQIMPKQFLRGIDKAGLDRGLLYDLRFDGAGRPRPGCVLNRPAGATANVLIGGPNFGCGSSREHAVWGLQQAGFKAVIATSFGEIFYSNAMNNGFMLVVLADAEVQALMQQAEAAEAAGSALALTIDVARLTLRAAQLRATFPLSPRHQRMFLDGLDVVGASLTQQARIAAFAAALWSAQPWLKDVAATTRPAPLPPAPFV